MLHVHLVAIVNKESTWLDEFKGCFLSLNKYLEMNCQVENVKELKWEKYRVRRDWLIKHHFMWIDMDKEKGLMCIFLGYFLATWLIASLIV